jgi:His-Xaa-Ser system radical SAM maturase HxsC
MLNFSGTPSSRFSSFIGAVTTTRQPFYSRHGKVLVTKTIDAGCLGYLGVITSCAPKKSMLLPNMIGHVPDKDLDQLINGDVVCLEPTGIITVFWEIASHQNALFLTEACNCICKMCPQPPQKHDDLHYKNSLMVLDLLKMQHIEEICITGGEPTLNKKQFIDILKRCIVEHPESNISILTNAKKFSDQNFTRSVSYISTQKVIFCVSLHSDIDTLHDDIVGIEGSYEKTQAGIYNLARYRLPIEIRHVISKINCSRLQEFSGHMYRYFPFCQHYAFMALEMRGLAEKNFDEIYIHPRDYEEELRNAVLLLSRRGLAPSVYNVPLCFCHPEIRLFARKSISSWKNDFLEKCAGCAKRDACCGFFTTPTRNIPQNVTPFVD